MATDAIPDEKPFHLRGNYAPVSEEVTAFDLPVQGAIPPELSGLYLRNGPNPKTGESAHWFLGDGMLHAVKLHAGRAEWYRNRYLRTKAFLEDAPTIREDGSVDLAAGVANTNVIGHAGKILALVEICHPTAVTELLETIGPDDLDGRLQTGMTAHPKVCPRTGELHFFSYAFFPPFLTYHRADAAGKLVQSEIIEVPGPTMIHDFAITENYVVFMDLPVVFDLEIAMQGKGMPYGWSDEYGARLGLMPRGGNDAQTRWFDIEPCYVFHPVNAYEDEGQVVVDVARYSEIWRRDSRDFQSARLHRFSIDREAAKVAETPLDDRSIEFPRVDERLVGLQNRYGYAVANASNISDDPAALVKYDLRTGRSEGHEFGAGCAPGEAVFVPASDAAEEDAGWLLSYVYDASTDGSELVILDAQSLAAQPVARVALPQRVPFGFHGNWIAGAG